MLHLRHGAFELDLAPEAGGSVAGFRADGVDLLYNDGIVPPGGPSALSMCAFPLVPFCGRIDRGRFAFSGTPVTLAANLPPEPHAIHGQGWQGVWEVEWSSHSAAALRFEHLAGDWPWQYEARQTLVLDRHGLSIDLELCNTGVGSMPAGLGWHPYFPRRDAALGADVDRIWRSGEEMIPGEPAPVSADCDLRLGRPVADLTLDDTFSVTSRVAVLDWPDRTLTLDASAPLDFLVVYTPQGRDCFCVEPISHVPDAVNSPLPAARTGLRALAPGQSLSARITLALEVRA